MAKVKELVSRKAFPLDEARRNERRKKSRTRKTYFAAQNDEKAAALTSEIVTSDEQTEICALISRLTRRYAAELDFYKSEFGGGLSHDAAVEQVEAAMAERRARVDTMPVREIDWLLLCAVHAESIERGLDVWAQIRNAACDEFESGVRTADVVDAVGPYERAQYLAIRDAFIEQWQPQGGLEMAMIDMLTMAFSLQLYWSTIAHQRATRTHDSQSRELKKYETSGWKSPYQWEADAVEQAHRLADGYNRQFLRVLRQMRDLRRYSVPVTINNPQQVNIAANGSQQINVADKDKN